MNPGRALSACILAFAVGPGYAEMYKCVDERGVVSYSEQPRPGCKGGKVDNRPIPPAGGKAETQSEDIKGQEADFRRRQLERAEADTKERAAREKELAARTRHCEGLKQDYVTLDSPRRIVTDVNPKGERTYMDDETRNKRLAEIREQLRECK